MPRKLSVRLPQMSSRGSARTGRTAEEIVGLVSVSKRVIYPHVFANADREVGGVLVGRMPSDGKLPLLTGAIPAISADERRATLTFTQDAWAHVHKVLERDFPPDEQIVGWYHSHPGFGIFLSGHDLFIHENFFGASSQIAVVVDPFARTEGVFVWTDSGLATLFERPTPPGWEASLPEGSHDAAPHGGNHPHIPLDVAREPYPLLAIVVAAVLGTGAGFGLWRALSSSPGSASPPAQTLTVRRHAKPSAKTITTVLSDVERSE